MKPLIVFLLLFAVPVWAGESFMDINPEDLGCVGDAKETKYHQRCVERCVVNGVGGFSYLGQLKDMASGDVGEYYLMGGAYICPNKLTREACGQLYADAQRVAKDLCGKGNLLRVVTVGMSGTGVQGVVACKAPIRRP